MIYLDYIKYLFRAKDEYGLHSPFLFEFYTKNIKDKNQDLEKCIAIEDLRKALLKDKREISVTDLGAGSKLNNQSQRKVSDITKNAQKPPKLAKFLHQIISYYKYKNVFDLGTSLGLTTAYLASQEFDNKTVSFEGCAETAKIAKENFDKLSLKNIEIVLGNIDETLPEKLNKIERLDFVFFDANHRYEPTIRYFEQCLLKANEQSCFVFDDIYWSDEMKQAWQTISNHNSVSVSIDMFWVGIVFFRKKQPKQHFVLKF